MARAITSYTRRGGLLIGPAPARDWPPELGRHLRGSGRAHVRGVDGLRDLGLGRVGRAETRDDVIALLEAGAWVPAVASRLTGPMPPAPLPSARFRWRDRPSERRPQGVLLLIYAGVVGALTWLTRRRGVQVLALVLAAGAVSVCLVWLSPSRPGVRVEGLVTDLGGPGGRRAEAVVIGAGPEGFTGHVTWRGGGVLSWHGAHVGADGLVRVPPGGVAWIVRESAGAGVRATEPEDRRAAFLGRLLVGAVDPRRLRYGRLPSLPVTVEGVGPIPAWTATYRSE